MKILNLTSLRAGWRTPVILFLALGGAFWAGRISVDRSRIGEDAGDLSAHGERRARIDRERDPGGRRDGRKPTGESDPAAKQDRARKAMIAALTSGDPVKRNATSWQLIESMDKDNWKGVYDGFLEAAKIGGRMQDGMFNEALKRIGQVAPEAAVAEWTRSGTEIPTSFVYGWGMGNPGQAMAWANEFDGDKRRYIQSVISGAALMHPEQGRELMAGLSPELWKFSLGNYVWNTVQSEGVTGAQQWLETLTDSDQITSALNAMRGDVENAASNGWDTKNLSRWVMTNEANVPQGKSNTQQIISRVIARSPAQGGELIVQLKRDGVELQPEQIDRVVGGIAPGKLEELRQWAKACDDPSLGDALEASVQKRLEPARSSE